MADTPETGNSVVDWVIKGLLAALASAGAIIARFYYKQVSDYEEEEKTLKEQIAALTRKVEEMSQTILALEKKNAANEEKIKHLEYELGKKVNRETLERRLSDQ